MTLAPNRRRFLTFALGFVAAPFIVRAASIMPVRAMPWKVVVFEQVAPGAMRINRIYPIFYMPTVWDFPCPGQISADARIVILYPNCDLYPQYA